ncbi:MAG: amidohydrolase family protein [Alphaproteobacteria bacterium]|nr:amidohydrolase family protein [Alphaproteobacteria bacterium]
MSEIRIDNALVVTMDGGRRVLDGQSVAVSGSRIAAIGPRDELARAYPDATVIDGTRKALMPGFVDVHAHAGHGLIKTLGVAVDGAWERACHTAYTIASDTSFWAAEAALSAVERIRCGTTTGVSYLGGGDDVMRTDEAIYADAHCREIDRIGTRSVVAVGINRPPFPKTYANIENGGSVAQEVSFETQLGVCKEVAQQWHGGAGGRVRIAVSFPVHHRGSFQDAVLDEVRHQAAATRDLTRRLGLVFTQDGHRQGSIRLAHEVFDLLGSDALMSHSVDLDAEEIRLVAETGTKIAHNPSANRSITGRCPVPELIDAGAVVGLGSDGTAPDRGYDMFRHMFQAMHYHRRHFRDPAVLPPGKVLEMATIDGAAALGMAEEIGSIEVGKQADLILVDLFKPHMVPMTMPLYRLACFANGADVDTTIVAGRILMRDRELVGIDEDAVLEEAERQSALMVERAGLKDLERTPERFWGVSRG